MRNELQIDRALEVVDSSAKGRTRYEGMPERVDETLAAAVKSLREQLRLCEISLGTFDEGCSSEYWERYPGNPVHE